MNSRLRRRKAVINGDPAVSLLYPAAALLRSGGLSKTQALAAFTIALDYVDNSKGKKSLEHIGASMCFVDLIAAWSRDRKFLDARGRPRALRLSGANGFTALVKSTGARQDPKQLLRILIRYRNVRRLRDGRVKLISPLFRVSAGSRIAFEPNAHFLGDAASTLTHILSNVDGSRVPDLFWRSVESTRISKGDTAKFMEFAKDRSMLFLEELDDWLEARERSSTHSAKKTLRIGLGLFSIYSQGAHSHVPRR
jgi:hypothetical protein